MEAVLSTWTTKDLKEECAKNGMAQYGDKATLVQRIIDNVPGKRKPGPKAGISKKSKTSTASAKDTYFAKQRKTLVALGITDKKTQDAELEKRWTVHIAKSKDAKTSKPKTMTFPFQLDKKQMLAMGNLTLFGTTTDAAGVVQYEYAQNAPKSKPTAAQLRTLAAADVAIDADDDNDNDDDDGSSESGDSQRSDDLLDDETFKTYHHNMTSRLVQQTRVTKKMLQDMVIAFDPEAQLSGADKTELAEMLIDELMYETDEEDDE